jgi:hypothetical protein
MFSQVRTHFRGLPPPLLLLLLLALVLHGGRVVSAAAAEEHEDEEGETAEGWDDVLVALEPFHKEKGELCAACSFVAGRINAKWTRHAYKLKKWSAKKKLKKARRAVKKACKGISKMQMCKSGAGSSTKFEDFNVMMQSGTISNINMAGHYAVDLQRLCDSVTMRILDFVPEKMADVARIFDYKLEKDLCHRIMPTCSKKKLKSRGGKGAGGAKKKQDAEPEVEAEESAAEDEPQDDDVDTETIEL